MDRELEPLIHACYQGPLEESPWQTLLQLLQQQLQARFVTFLLRPPTLGDGGVVLNARLLSHTAYDEYKQHYFSEDPFVDLPPGKAFTSDDLLDNDSFRQSSFYRNYLQQVDVAHILGIDLASAGGFGARLRISRGSEGSNFTQEDKALLEQLGPHLGRAVVLYGRIIHAESRLKPYQDGFDQMEIGCLIVDASFRVLSCNRAAADLLEKRQGVTVRQGELQVGSREEDALFREQVTRRVRAMREQGSADAVALRVALPSSVTGLGVLCRAMPPAATPDSGPAAAVFFSNPETPRPGKVAILENLFGLSLAEARLALLLANGLCLDDAALDLAISRNTAKSQLSSVFLKTGVTRQGALVQLILRSVAAVG